MPLVEVSKLTGAALDWAVAKCEGRPYTFDVTTGGDYNGNTTYGHTRNYSTNWAQGGPIIERERISIHQWTNVPVVHAYMPFDGADWAEDGASPLIAAMRCYVASKLGDVVEIPEELT